MILLWFKWKYNRFKNKINRIIKFKNNNNHKIRNKNRKNNVVLCEILQFTTNNTSFLYNIMLILYKFSYYILMHATGTKSTKNVILSYFDSAETGKFIFYVISFVLSFIMNN